MRQQGPGRRAWGAPPPPRPAPQRRGGDAAAEPGEATAAPPAAPTSPAKQQRGPGKAWLSKLASATASPRAGTSGRRQQTTAGPPSATRAKQQQQAAVVHVQVAAAATQPPAQPQPNAAAWTAPPPIPALSPPDLPTAPLAAHSPLDWLRGREEEDVVLIGSAAPSFSIGPAQLPDAGHLAGDAERALPAATSGLAAEPAAAAHPRRASLLATQLAAEDLSLAALAAASRGSSRHGSAGSSMAPSSGGGGARLAAPPLPERYASDCEDDGPAAAPVPEPGRPPLLNLSELAVLRESMRLLDLGGSDPLVPASTSDADLSAAAEGQPDIPDQVVLRELSSRLCRLDSHKRRMLLEVLSKLDVSPNGAAESAEAAAAAPRANSTSRASGSGDQAAGASEEHGKGSLEEGAAVPGGSTLAAEDGGALAGLQPYSQGLAVPLSLTADEADTAGEVKAAQSPSKALCGKLAALRLGRTSLAGREDSPQPQAISNSAGMALAVGDAAAAMPPLSRQSSLGQAGSAGHPLQSMVQQRQRERSRFSVDGRHARQPAAQQPASSIAGGSSDTAAAAGDALAAFEMAADEQDESQPGLAASPTVLALGAWQLLPDALDAASGATLPAARCSRASAGGSSGLLIPRCPSGKVLELSISSTWGDQHYVGLAALELFDSAGQPVSIREPRSQVSAIPHSINVLPEYSSDPRTADKLLDGVCMTCDDAHVWLAPFTPGALHTVRVALDASVALGALRVWNYNKSRIHSLRGARQVEIALDGSPVFRGELRQAPGIAAEAYRHAELILFTDDAAALAAIDQYDARYSGQLAASSAEGSGGVSGHNSAGSSPGSVYSVGALDLVTSSSLPAPPTLSASQLARTSTLGLLPQVSLPAGRQQLVSGGRPLTAALSSTPVAGSPPRALGQDRRATGASSSRGSSGGTADASFPRCKELVLVLLDSWGDSHFMGLAGLQVLGGNGQPLPLAASRVAADPPDLNVFPGHSGDVRTVDKLVDGTANTTDDTHMWLAPIRRKLSTAVLVACNRHRHGPDRAALPEAARSHNLLLVSLEAPSTVTGLRVWNYNKNAADTARGVKRMAVLADGVELSPPGGLLLRRAPGTAGFDFGQHLPLATCWAGGAARMGRPRGTVQHSSSPGAASGLARPSLQGLTLQCESVAWACNMPDPAAALDYLQRATAASKGTASASPLLQQPAEGFGTTLPCGFSLRLVMLTTWGCPHYIGLSGLEVLDAARGPLRIRPDQVHAAPASVALLPGMAADARTPDKLVDGVVSGVAAHSWLAPLDRQEGNSVLLVLDAPLLLGSISVWNYAKTPSRGVQELEVYLDEQLVWKGLLRRAPEALAPGEDFSQALCFGEEAAAAEAAAAQRRAGGRRTLGHAGSQPAPAAGVDEWCQRQEAVVLVNEGQFVAFPPDAAACPASARPITAVVAAWPT